LSSSISQISQLHFQLQLKLDSKVCTLLPGRWI